MNSHRQPVAVYTVSCTLPARRRPSAMLASRRMTCLSYVQKFEKGRLLRDFFNGLLGRML
jgi:hypothetical protein